MRKSIVLAAALVVTAAAPAVAQRTIAAGMTPAQVRTAFGAPATTRVAGEWAYWYYQNGCPRRCGSDDVVFFHDDKVVAAVLRTGARRFSGPAANRALEPYDDVTAAGGTPAERPLDLGVRGNPLTPEERERQRQERERGVEESSESPPARVGGVRVEPRSGEGRSSTVIRGADEARPTPLRRGEVEVDTTTAPSEGDALRVDDARRARESQVSPTTIPAREDTAAAARRAREQQVRPRTVPRNP
ncbi:MAG TPA: hypothetical protein VFQ39_20460 [Longimicrobium sp.]|nr:hypothetical protein [Longimicrobium sp.]